MLLSELILYFHRLKDIFFFNLKTVFACKRTAVTSPIRADVEKHVLRQPNTAIKSMQLFTQSWGLYLPKPHCPTYEGILFGPLICCNSPGLAQCKFQL